MNYKTIFYEKADGTSPAKDFLISLDYDMRIKIYKSDYFARKGKRQIIQWGAQLLI